MFALLGFRRWRVGDNINSRKDRCYVGFLKERALRRELLLSI
jgi:hypothetical protein